MKTPIFCGSAIAIITPFTESGIDYARLGKLIEWQIASGTDAIIISGTTGESSTMTHLEHTDVIRFCVETVNKRVPVVANAGSNSTEESLSLSRAAQQCGADGLLLVTPYYNKTTQAGLVGQFSYIADRVNIPIVLYNVPSRTGLSFTADTYYALSKHPTINGIKEASGDLGLVAQTRAKCGGDLFIWSGNDENIVPILSLGGKGVISVMANIIPAETARICALWREGKAKESMALQLKYMGLIDALFCEVNPIPVKTAMAAMRLDSGRLRMPLWPMGEQNKAFLLDEMRKVGLL